jgi:DNA primase
MFYLSQGNTTEVEKKWYGRLIIPFYRDNKLIFYQGRSLNESTRRYINSTVSNDAVILYNYKELTRNVDDPLFITEGFFDAYHLNGVAINGNELSPKKITVINQSRRRKIYIPDRYGNGKQAAFNAIEAGWDIAIPDIGDCKDINQAVVRFGLLYVYKSLMCNIKSGFNAKVAVNTLCK